MRRSIDFNQGWLFSKEKEIVEKVHAALEGRHATDCASEEDGTEAASKMEAVTLPHTWNAVDGQDGGNDYYRGTCVYRKEFDGAALLRQSSGSALDGETGDALKPGQRVVLEFEGAAMTADVWMNGRHLTHHEGGYSTFWVDITEHLHEKSRLSSTPISKKDDVLEVFVDNSVNDHVYPQKADFTFYGGIYRDVKMVILEEEHFAFPGTEAAPGCSFGVKVTPKLTEKKDGVAVGAQVEAESTLILQKNSRSQLRYTIYAPDGCGRDYWRQAHAVMEKCGSAPSHTAGIESGPRMESLCDESASDCAMDDVPVEANHGGESAECLESFLRDHAKMVASAVLPLRAETVCATAESETKSVSETESAAESGCVGVNTIEEKNTACLAIPEVKLWNGIENPYLYILVAELVDEAGTVLDCQMVRFGCREFSFDREQGFFLNGRSYPLRGVARHQDRAGVGNALTRAMHEEDLDMICEMGANTIRLAHYQHARYFYDLCDEAGMVVWAEIPYITKHMPNGRENTLSQMRELVTQCYNHPSIICWGLSNEITASGTATEDLMENHRLLNSLCHSLDSTRPTTMAHVFMLETDSPLIEIADIGSYNLYFGWYLGSLEQNDAFFDEYHAKYPDRIIGFSEYGADANPQYQSNAPEQGDYTETYQCVYHEHILKCIEQRPYLWATHVWNMFDFAADGRDEGGKHGENQKGLVTFDRKLKKDAFYLYKAYWSKEPFVHICGRRYVNRTGERTEIKVYSNQPEISLYVDGALVETKQADKVFVFQIPLTGTHQILASAYSKMDGAYLEDTIEIQKAKTSDPSYQMLKKEEVVNWFDRDTLDPACFSIEDTLGAICQVPEGAEIIEKMMTKARASRGDVAASTSGNKNLDRMMAGMKVSSLLKQAGEAFSAEEIGQLNQALQKIRK